jgi:hypothetical protein
VIVHCLGRCGLCGSKILRVQICSFHGCNFYRVFFSLLFELFLVLLAKLANSFFMLSDSCSRLSSLFRFGSVDGELSSFSGCAADLLSSLLGVRWASLILMVVGFSLVRTLL